MSGKTAPLPPGSTIGIFGGGQLGRMTALAAARLGYRCHVFTPERDSPCAQVAAGETVADYEDYAALDVFAAKVQVVTSEFENVSADALRHLAAHVPVRPGPEVFAIAQDRLKEKTFCRSIGAATTPFCAAHGAEDVNRALTELGVPAVLKTARMGYDGKGQVKIAAGDDPAAAWRSMGASLGIVEAWVPFEREISVIVARGVDGAMLAYPAVENSHKHHILDETIAPANIAPAVAAEAERLARHIAEKLDVIGLLTVELFVTGDGRVLVNELAPRPHNSGHWTIDACITSQFEQCVRAVCGLPLGSVERHSDAVMKNLIGDDVAGWLDLLRDPAAKLHLYGKAETRPGRKMGHVTWLKPRADRGADTQPDRDLTALLAGAPIDARSVAVKRCRHGVMAFLKRDQYVGRSLDLYGEYSEGETALLARYLTPGAVVVEAGANIGAHTLMLARAVGAAGGVIAFEPQRILFQILCANLALNELRNVFAFQAALGAKPGQTVVPILDYTKSNNFGGIPVGAARGEATPLRTVDGLGLPRLDLLKADVEGMEMDVVRGAADTIARLKPVLYLEADPRYLEGTLIDTLRAMGYRMWLHAPAMFASDNFFGHADNVFGDMVSINLLALPRDRADVPPGLREVERPDDMKRW